MSALTGEGSEYLEAGDSRRPTTAGLTHLAQKWPVYLLLIIGAMVMMIPFVWMISTSLKPTEELFVYPPSLFPKQLRWENYTEALTASYLPVWVYFKNSFMLSFPVAILDMVVCSLVAYGFARLRFRGRRTLFFILLATLMLPPQVTMIPIFLIFAKLKWVNTYLPIIVPALFGWPYGIFLLRQFFAGIPDELDDAAKIDGASFWGIFLRIHLPLAKPALGIVGILSFSQMWNEYLRPLIYLRDVELWPLSLALRTFDARSGGSSHWEYVMVISIITFIPPLLLFFVAQRYYIQGIVISGIKG